MKKINKLVRDKIPELIQKEEKVCGFHTIDNENEFLYQLKNKLIEESNEVLLAKNDEELIEELADLFEVIETLLKEKKLDLSIIRSKKTLKRNKNGSFNKRIYLEWID